MQRENPEKKKIATKNLREQANKLWEYQQQEIVSLMDSLLIANLVIALCL